MIKNVYDDNLYKFVIIENVKCFFIYNKNIEISTMSLNILCGNSDDP